HLDEIQAAFDEAKLSGIRVVIVAIGQSGPNDMLRLAASCDADCFFMGNSTDMTSVYASIIQSSCLEQNRRPVVSLGPARNADMRHPIQLAASVWDENPITLTYRWENNTPPEVGTVSFTPSSSAAAPQATFSVAGTYLLKLTVTDNGGLSSSA